VLEPTARPQIHGNTVVNCFSRGVYLEKTDDHDAFDNLIINCAQIRYTGGLEAQSNPLGYDVERDVPDDHVPRQVSGNRFFHNTVVGGWWSFSVNCSSPDCSISGTEVFDNILVRKNERSANLYLFGGGANDGVHGSGNTYTRNCFGEEGGSWVWGDALYRTYEILHAASEGAVRQSVAGKPRFRDSAKRDYRLDPASPCRGAAGDGSDLGARFPRSHDPSMW
jgi:hypothetical protein